MKTILYIDDDADDRDFLTDAFKSINRDISVITAENGAEGLDYLKQITTSNLQPPCLIVLDLNMPFLDGKETFKRLKEHPQLKDIPVYVFTSSENPNDKEYFNKMGIEMISKPSSLVYYNTIASQMITCCS